MKDRNIFRNFNYISIFMMCAALMIFSCTNFSSDNTFHSSGEKIKLTGTLMLPDTEGAVPLQMQEILSSLGQYNSNSVTSERAATVPSFIFDTTKHSYYAEAVKREGGQKITEVTWHTGVDGTTFSMELDYGIWDVTAGIKNISDGFVIYSSTEPVTIVEGGPKSYSKNFVAKPKQTTDGQGKLDLTISIENGCNISFAEVNYLSGNSTSWNTNFSTTNNSNLFGVSDEWEIKIGGDSCDLKSGTYTVQINFYDYISYEDNKKDEAQSAIESGEAVLVYSTIQTLNIYDNLTTNRWINSTDPTIPNSSPIGLGGDGTFIIFKSFLENFVFTNICISSNGSDSNLGTVYNPYKTLGKAISYINSRGSSNKDFTVSVSGDVECNTEISLDSGKAKSLTIKGKSGNNENDKLNGATKGRVLKINTTIPITIENLTITGGDAGSTPGGGILIDKSGATVILGDGAKVSGNKAQNGGGIWVQVGASLFMHGTALVGDSTNSKATGDTLGTGCSNCADYNGGGIYNNGNVYLGYSGMNNGTPVADTLSGGVRRNFSGMGGAGIENKSTSTLKINSGYVSYNVTKQITNVGNPGGGIRVHQSKLELSGGEISYNEADAGGGIEAASKADITISGGKISENTSRTGFGGAIEVSVSNSEDETAKVYLNGTFSIPYGVNGSKSAGKNDIYLTKLSSTRYAKLYVTGNLNPPNGVTTVATITMSGWKRNKKFLEKSGNLSALTETIISKFSFTDSDWGKQLTDSNAAAVITSPVYVAGTETNDNTRPSGFGAGLTKENGALGTKTKPFSTIKEALEVFEDTSEAEIFIVGTVIGQQIIGGSGVTIKPTKIKLSSYSTSTVGTIKRYNTKPTSPALDGTALTIDTTVPVTLNGITVSNGKKNGSGGGIYLQKTGAKVTLGDNTKIIDNEATDGAGVYVSNGTTLEITGSAQLTGNKANIVSNSGGNGGAVYNEGTLTMSAGTVGGSSSTYQNTAASYGGAVYQNGTFNLSGSANLYFSGNTAGTNDVYLNTYTPSGGTETLRTINISSTINATSVATITPGRWKRGDKVISSSTDSYITGSYSKFKVSDTEWTVGKYVSGTATADRAARIGADLWVAGSSLSSDVGDNVTGGKSPNNSNRGTKKQPYANIATAVAQCWDTTQSVPFTINVDGTVSGAQTIGSGSAINASQITITGYKTTGNSRATLNAGATSSSNKTTLTVNTGAKTYPVILTNLIITGGLNTNGGGIYLTKGTLKLGSGVKVEKNEATNGGGVYVAANGILCMYGSAMVGEGTAAYPSTTSPQGNKASYGGAGIYNNQGIVALGYTAYASESSNTKATGNDALTGGVCRNLSTTTESGNTNSGGAGIFNYKGIVSVNGGNISFNDCASKGGAIRNSNGGSETVYIHAGTIKYNKAAKGGAIYVQSSTTVELKGGLLTSNSATTAGGAVYQDGTFKVSGNAYIEPGTESLKNDVYLSGTSKYIEVASSLAPKSDGTSNGSAVTYTAAITPSDWTRGTQVLTGSYATNNYNKFKGSESDWFTIWDSSAAKLYTSYNIYVAGSANRATEIGAPKTKANGGLGTKAKPYASIDEAMAQCWDTADTKSKTFNIYVSGDIKDAMQTISTTSAKEILLKGYVGTGSGVTYYHSINRNLSSVQSNGGRCLYVNTTVPVKITNLTLTKGYTETGSGIYIGSSGQVYLGDGVVITGNKTPDTAGNISYSGAGVYVSSGAKLFMYGTARIGGSGTSIATESTGNYAKNGAGIYSSGDVYLGYSACDSSTGAPTTATSLSGGVTQNYSTGNAGGIEMLSTGKLYFKSGNISYNYSGAKGGGVMLDSTNEMTMVGGTIAGNKAETNGGGIYIYGSSTYKGGTFNMSGGTIGNSSASNPAENTSGKYSNYAANGGGIYADSKTTVNITGGDVYYNYASNNGGGLYWYGESLTVNSSSIHISLNGASRGGGIYIGADGNLGQAAMNKNQAVMSGGGLFINNGKKVTINGSLKIQNCKADGGSGSAYGGGIYNGSGAELTVSGGMLLSGNSAVTTGSSSYAQGGGIYNEGSVVWNAGTIGSNTCSNVQNGAGGAVYQNGTLTIKGGSFGAYSDTIALGTNDIHLPFQSKFVTISAYDIGYPAFSLPNSNYKIGAVVAKKGSDYSGNNDFSDCLSYKLRIVKHSIFSKAVYEASGGEEKGVMGIDVSDGTGLTYAEIASYVQGKSWTQQTSFTQIPEGVSFYIFKHTGKTDRYAIERITNTKSSTYAGTFYYSATIRISDTNAYQNSGVAGYKDYNCGSQTGEYVWGNHNVLDTGTGVGSNNTDCIHFKQTSSTSGIGMLWSGPLYAIKIN